jgi:hypothetical protein
VACGETGVHTCGVATCETRQPAYAITSVVFVDNFRSSYHYYTATVRKSFSLTLIQTWCKLSAIGGIVRTFRKELLPFSHRNRFTAFAVYLRSYSQRHSHRVRTNLIFLVILISSHHAFSLCDFAIVIEAHLLHFVVNWPRIW